MFNHAPKGYICPICLGIQGIENGDTLLKQDDLVFKDELVSVFINSFWIPTCEGHVIIVPNKHFENLYELPEEYLLQISKASQKISVAMKKAYQCDGVTLRQNNEPASEQHAFHYHLHLYPRYIGDSYNINMTKKSILSEPKERIKFKEKLASFL